MLFQSILQTCPWRRKSSPLKNEHVDPSWLENEQIKYLSRYYRFESLIPWPLTGTSVPAAADCQLHLRSTAGILENKASLADHGPPSLWVSQKMPPGTVRFRNIPTSCTNVGSFPPEWSTPLGVIGRTLAASHRQRSSLASAHDTSAYAVTPAKAFATVTLNSEQGQVLGEGVRSLR